jgi:hypothetical protein
LSSDLPHLQGLTELTGKNLTDEARWAHLNDLLKPVETMLEMEAVAPQRPIVFILGPPRSGSTLLSQVLAATGAFGVTSNFVARFWLAPALGIRLEQAMGENRGPAKFESERGRTTGPGEPHEFGYFWSRWFDLGQETHKLSAALLEKVDIAGLKAALGAMEAAAAKPLMVKNNTWFTFQANWLARQFPTGVFVACSRAPFFIAQSIYVQRVALGDAARWWSVRPPNFAGLRDLSPLEQVASQALEIQREMQKVLATVPVDRLIHADYEQLCSNPRSLVSDVFQACKRLGGIEGNLDAIPERFHNTDRVRMEPSEAERLRRLIVELAADDE